MNKLKTQDTMSYPAVRGVQAQCEYYVSMVKLGAVARLLIFDDKDIVPPQQRAQRRLNTRRLPELTQYITDNPTSYVFSALTVSVGAEVVFEPIASGDKHERLGMLHIPTTAKIVVNDGQHRRQAIENAVRSKAINEHETIAVVFFLDPRLERCQQMFADLNRHAVRPSQSLGVLYDHRSKQATLTRTIVKKTPIFRDLVESEKNSLGRGSGKLFTLSAIHTATKALLPVPPDDALATEEADLDELATQGATYWNEVAEQFPHWTQVQQGRLYAHELRSSHLHAHGIALHALGRIGNYLRERGGNWKAPLERLALIDWSRENSALWEGRALTAGSLSKSGKNVILTTNVIKRALDLPLSADEQKVEEDFIKATDKS